MFNLAKFKLIAYTCLICFTNAFADDNDMSNSIDPTSLHYSVYAESVPHTLVDGSKLKSGDKLVEFTNFSFRIAAGAPDSRDYLTSRIPIANLTNYLHLMEEKKAHEKIESMKIKEASAKSIKYQPKPYKPQCIMTSRSISLGQQRFADSYTYPTSGEPIDVRGIAKIFPLDQIHSLPFANMVSIILTYDKVTKTPIYNKFGQVTYSKKKQRTIGGYSVQEISPDKLKGASQFHVQIKEVYLDKSNGKTRVAADFKLFKNFKGTCLNDYTENDSIQKLNIRAASDYVFY